MNTEHITTLEELAPALLHALRLAMVVISQHYPEGAECCEGKIQRIREIIAITEQVPR